MLSAVLQWMCSYSKLLQLPCGLPWLHLPSLLLISIDFALILWPTLLLHAHCNGHFSWHLCEYASLHHEWHWEVTWLTLSAPLWLGACPEQSLSLGFHPLVPVSSHWKILSREVMLSDILQWMCSYSKLLQPPCGLRSRSSSRTVIWPVGSCRVSSWGVCRMQIELPTWLNSF